MTIQNRIVSIPAEWAEQDAILLAWPHADTDWKYMLDEVTECYKNIAKSILTAEDLIIVTPDIAKAKHDLAGFEGKHHIYFHNLPTNDTWARDFGPITVIHNGIPTPLDFKFDAWGMKFAADKDNLVTSRLSEKGLFKVKPINHRAFVLEGGSIESDGNGTLMVTSKCLLSPNRNAEMTRDDIEQYLMKCFGVSNVLWVEHGEMAGDDTDSHIDTIARFAPNNTIVYNGPADNELAMMEEELQSFKNANGDSYRLISLPVPDPIFDEEGLQIPATYANFLVINGHVLVPTYGQLDNDKMSIQCVSQAFPSHKVIGINCNALIKQHGSLHCVTMQFPKNTINK